MPSCEVPRDDAFSAARAIGVFKSTAPTRSSVTAATAPPRRDAQQPRRDHLHPQATSPRHGRNQRQPAADRVVAKYPGTPAHRCSASALRDAASGHLRVDGSSDSLRGAVRRRGFHTSLMTRRWQVRQEVEEQRPAEPHAERHEMTPAVELTPRPSPRFVPQWPAINRFMSIVLHPHHSACPPAGSVTGSARGGKRVRRPSTAPGSSTTTHPIDATDTRPDASRMTASIRS